jgi:hypothetical protein
MSKSTNTVVYFDWKTVIYIYGIFKLFLLRKLKRDRQVEFLLAKKVPLKFQGSRAVTENQLSLSPMCCPFTLCTADDTHFNKMTENQ